MKACYIHIPFCDTICSYCDFAKILKNTVNEMVYLDALFKEFSLYEEKEGAMQFDTIYFGGGTPSSLSVEAIEKLLAFFEKYIAVAKEVTFEANPESLTLDKIKLLCKYGVNRVSLGVQTFNEVQLHLLNRKHSLIEVQTALEHLRSEGITNINLDLIYALPNQTMEMLIDDVTHLQDLAPTHISTYALIIEDHTKFGIKVEQGAMHEVDEQIQAEMYGYLQAIFGRNGYSQYEVSNWSLGEKHASKHNLTYWSNLPYLGIGLGSHGYIGNRRYGNTRAITRYLSLLDEGRLPVVSSEELTKKQQMEEAVFLGLRKTAGVRDDEFFQRFGLHLDNVFGEIIRKHVELENIVIEDNTIKLTSNAIFISNEVLSDFLLDDM